MNDTTNKRPQQPDGRKARTRAAIMRAANALFAERGYDGATVDEIAEEAGVSVASMYVHFRGKEQLWIALIEAGVEANDGHIEEAQQAQSPLQRVLNVGDAYLRLAIEHPVAFRFIAMRPVEVGDDRLGKKAERLITDRVQTIIASVAADLQAAIDAGELAPVPVEDAMAYLWGSWSGVASLVVRQDSFAISAEHAASALNLAKEVLVRGLTVHAPKN